MFLSNLPYRACSRELCIPSADCVNSKLFLGSVGSIALGVTEFSGDITLPPSPAHVTQQIIKPQGQAGFPRTSFGVALP